MAEHTSCVNDGGGNSSHDKDEGRNPDLEIYYMKQALSVAREALSIGEVPVGCVIVLRDGTTIIEPSSIQQQSKYNDTNDLDNDPGCINSSSSVIVSHGANQVNATRDATRHAEMVAIDRMLTLGRSSDKMKLSSDIICKSAHGKNVPQSYKEVDDDKWINIPQCKDHWKNTFGWGSGRVYKKEIFTQCDLYVTCEPCIMCAAALSMIGINRVYFGCKNDRFGGCGSLLNLHKSNVLPSSKHHGFEIIGGILEEEAILLLRSFYDRENFHAPDHKRKRKPNASTEEGACDSSE